MYIDVFVLMRVIVIVVVNLLGIVVVFGCWWWFGLCLDIVSLRLGVTTSLLCGCGVCLWVWLQFCGLGCLAGWLR